MACGEPALVVRGGAFEANVAAERQLPAITGYRLSRMDAARKLASGERLALPAPGKQSTALVVYMPPLTPDEWLHRQEEKPWLLMRPPTVVNLLQSDEPAHMASEASLSFQKQKVRPAIEALPPSSMVSARTRSAK